MAQKYYVIWQGRQTGVFTDWNTCKGHIDKFAGARYKSFKTLAEAEAAFQGEDTSASKPPLAYSRTSTIKKASSTGLKTYAANEIKAMLVDTKIFTDGGCVPNPGEAGSGVAVYRGDMLKELWFGLYNPEGTNNTAELNALHQAMAMAGKECEQGRSVSIFCDSKYSIQCITQWAVSWEKKGWIKKGGEIKNLDLIKEMFALYQSVKDDIEILHVNGHVGVEGNELADRMSIVAIDTKSVDFIAYDGVLDVRAILAMRAG